MNNDIDLIGTQINKRINTTFNVSAAELNITDTSVYENRTLYNKNILNFLEVNLFVSNSIINIHSLIFKAHQEEGKIYITKLDVENLLLEIEFKKEIQ